MGWFTDIIQELPLAAVQREHRELIETKLADAASRIRTLEEENVSLRNKVATLQAELNEYAKQDEFRKYRGLLWKSSEPVPYCPRCQVPMMDFPPNAHYHWHCSQCDLMVPFCDPPE